MYRCLGERTGIASSSPFREVIYLLIGIRLGIDKDTLIPISRADEKKVCSSKVFLLVELTGLLVQARTLLHRELPERWKKELMHMLYTRRKAETEILSSVTRSPGEPHPLVGYLGDKIWGCICSAVIGLQTNDGG
jgi:hypothetical protein